MDLLAIFVTAIAAFVLGFLWHGPLFGKMWMRLSGISQAEVDAAQAKGMGAMAPQMFTAFVQQIVVALVVAYLLGELGISDAMGAAWLACVLWLGFIAMTLLNQVLWEKKSLSLYFFGIIYHLVSLILTSVVLVEMI